MHRGTSKELASKGYFILIVQTWLTRKALIKETEDLLEKWKHPDPYKPPTAPGGMTLVPIDLVLIKQARNMSETFHAHSLRVSSMVKPI